MATQMDDSAETNPSRLWPMVSGDGLTPAPIELHATLELSEAQIWLAGLNHRGPREHMFGPRDVFWVDLCLTPRRREAEACFVEHWSAHRYSAMGPLIVLPPHTLLHLKHAGGRHMSVLCALQASAVEQWLPPEFEWTDRHREACLSVASAPIRDLLVRLSNELRNPGVASRELSDASVTALSIELARYLFAIDEPTDRGGLAAWRLRIIDRRLSEPGQPPTLAELADLCKVSVRQLTRAFRVSRGSTIGAALTASRIEAAKRRLATNESIKSIAAATGFSSQSTFTLAFRVATGITPSDFRQRIVQRLGAERP